MKKVLLGTTTLVGAALLAGAASAETPKVTVGGFIDFQAGIMSDDQDANRRNHAFRNDTEISFKVDGKSDSGLGYGAEIWLEADVENDADNQGTNASKTFIYAEGGWGRLEGGSNLGPDATMKVDAASIARATGGIDGDWTYFVNGTPSAFIATPDLLLNYGASNASSGLGDESQENLNKFTYYTPRWNGLQLGLSYVPSDQERGQLTNNTTRTDNAGTNTLGTTDTITLSEADSIWIGAIRYDGKFDQIGFSLAATGNLGDAEDNTYEDLRAWNVGAKVSFMGFSLAGSYGDWGDSLRLKTANTDDNDYWTVGGAYEYGPFGASVTYLKSNTEVSSTTDNEFDNLSVGVDYKLAPGFTPYAEVSFFEQDAVTASQDNDGTIFIVGSQLAF